MGVIIFDMDEEIIEPPAEEIYQQKPRQEAPMLDLALEIVPLEE